MNKKTTIGVILLLVVVAAVGVWVYFATKPADAEHNDDHTHSEANAHNNDSNTATASATITANDDGFSPATVTVKKGQSVKVVNKSSSDIEFSSADHPTHLQDPELNMDTLKPGEEGTVTPENVGTHGYHDHLNSGHTGKIVVTE